MKIIEKRRRKLTALGNGLLKDLERAGTADKFKKKADLLLAGQRALPNALRARNFQFKYQDLTEALENLVDR